MAEVDHIKTGRGCQKERNHTFVDLIHRKTKHYKIMMSRFNYMRINIGLFELYTVITAVTVLKEKQRHAADLHNRSNSRRKFKANNNLYTD